MKTNFSDLQTAYKEFGTPYTVHEYDPAVEALLEWLDEKGVLPYEYLYYIFTNVGANKLVKRVMCSPQVQQDFLIYRDQRLEDSRIKSELEKRRLEYLLEQKMSVKAILDSGDETFFVLLRYILAKMARLNTHVEMYREGALYELKVSPELRRLFGEFEDRFFPDSEGKPEEQRE